VKCVEEIWQEYQADPLGSGYSFLICRDEADTVRAFTCYGPHPLTQGTYDLYWIAVDPEARGQGIGHLLLSEAEGQVQAAGGRLLLVETSNSDGYAGARGLYSSSGYRLEATVHDFYAPGDDLLMYAKDLKLPLQGELSAHAVASMESGTPR
jgi:ribosomal protein S18 acetylase RimI-like enzyme